MTPAEREREIIRSLNKKLQAEHEAECWQCSDWRARCERAEAALRRIKDEYRMHGHPSEGEALMFRIAVGALSGARVPSRHADGSECGDMCDHDAPRSGT